MVDVSSVVEKPLIQPAVFVDIYLKVFSTRSVWCAVARGVSHLLPLLLSWRGRVLLAAPMPLSYAMVYTSTSRAMLQSYWSELLTICLRDTAAAAADVAATATGVSRTHSSGMRLAGTVVLQGETELSERKVLVHRCCLFIFVKITINP